MLALLLVLMLCVVCLFASVQEYKRNEDLACNEEWVVVGGGMYVLCGWLDKMGLAAVLCCFVLGEHEAKEAMSGRSFSLGSSTTIWVVMVWPSHHLLFYSTYQRITGMW